MPIAYRHVNTGEIVIPTPDSDYARRLKQGDVKGYEPLDLDGLKDALGEDAFDRLPKAIKEGTAPPQHPKVPRETSSRASTLKKART